MRKKSKAEIANALLLPETTSACRKGIARRTVGATLDVKCSPLPQYPLIQSFKDKDTETLYQRKQVKRFSGIARQAVKRLRILDSADTLQALAALPSNRLEALKGDRQGQYNIRVNDQWRVCFVWNAGANEVEIVDYH